MHLLLTPPGHALHGFPPYPKERVAAVPMLPCRIYYPRYYDLTLEQRAYYLYWRQEYEDQRPLPADATYRFLYAYELAQRAENAQQLEQLWIDLRKAYQRRDAITRTLSTWITDLRLQQGRVVYDEITESIGDRWLMLDIAIAAGIAPRAQVLLELYSARTSLPTSVAHALLDRHALLERIDTEAVLEAAREVTPAATRRELFINIGESRKALSKFGRLEITINSFRRSSAVTATIDAIVEAMLEIIGRRIPIPQKALRETIVRRAIANLPDAQSSPGITWSAESVWTRESILLLLLVLWLSETKPYVEGRIAFARGLRGQYQTIGAALGMHVTIGTMRQAYWSLSHGPRAVWVLDPKPREAAEIRSNLSAARFTKKAQHLFAGSAARAQAISMFCTQLAKRTHVPVKRIQLLLTEITHTAPTMRNPHERH